MMNNRGCLERKRAIGVCYELYQKIHGRCRRCNHGKKKKDGEREKILCYIIPK